MKTQIFKNYLDFLNREDKEVNGVSESFAAEHSDYEKQNETNKGCWNCSDCSRCSGCYDCSRCSGCSDCSGCSGCSDCSRCSGCYDCSRCSGCSGCSDLKDSAPAPIENNILSNIPIIENIHQKVLEAVSKEGALDMSAWHKSCGTTHCRAGWVVTMAGEQGKKLEEIVGTPHAALQIYHKSSPNIQVSPVRFYETNELAMADIKRCAELEAKGEE